MKTYTIFGNPVKHSKSPNMQNSGLKHIGFEGNYNTTLLEDGTQIKNIFLENGFYGANITVPHKENAFIYADEVRGLAQKIGAVNTYINENGKVVAYNTDAPGFMKAIEEFGTIHKAIIIGAGGTAKAIAVAFKDAGIKTTVLNRSENRLDFFKKLGCTTSSWDNFTCENYDLVINSTSAGLSDDSYPAPLELLTSILENGKFAIDCIYGKVTPFLAEAKKHNLPSKDGEDMLLYQGVIAFEYFTNTKATDELIEAMRNGLKS